MSDTTGEVPKLAYASAVDRAVRQGPRVWAAIGILFGGLGLVALGGCFLIGVLSMVVAFNGGMPVAHISAAGKVLMAVLYVMAGICFSGAAVIIVIGVRGLFIVVRSP